MQKVNSDQVAPTNPSVRWRAYALTGIAIMTGKALIVSVLILIIDPSLRTSQAIGKIGVICVFLGTAGVLGGLAYAACQRLGAAYYGRWIVAAEVTVFVLVLEVRILLSKYFLGQSEGSQQAAYYLIMNPFGWMILAGLGAIGGLVYGKTLSD